MADMDMGTADLFPAARQAYVVRKLDELAKGHVLGRQPNANRDAALARDLIRLNDQLLVGLAYWPAAKDFVAEVLAREGLSGGPA